MDLGMVNLPLYSGLFAAILMVMQIVLMFRVIQQRGASEILIGDGGVDAMQLKIRVHGNFIETTPVFLIGLALAEMAGGTPLWIISLGGIFLASRLAHAIAFSMNPGVSPGRFVGTLASMLTTVVTAGYLAYLVMGRM